MRPPRSGTMLVSLLACLPASGQLPDRFIDLSTAGSAPSPRDTATAVFDAGANRLIVFGGGTVFSEVPADNDVWVLDLASFPADWGSLAVLGTPPTPRLGHIAIVDTAANRMVVHGGLTAPATFAGDLHALSLAPGSEAWAPIAAAGPAPGPRGLHFAAYDALRDRMILIGGTDGNADFNDVHALSLAPGAEAWSPISPSGSPPRTGGLRLGALDEANDRILVAGGLQWTSQNPIFDFAALALQPGTETWTVGQPLPYGIIDFYRGGAAYDSDRARVLMYPAFSAEAFVISGTPPRSAWLAADGDSPVRLLTAPAYDSIGRRLLVFGGRDDQFNRVNGVLALVLSATATHVPVTVTPSRAYIGEPQDIAISGTATSFSPGTSQLLLVPATAGTVNGVTVTSATAATGNVTLAAGASATGVVVLTGGEVAGAPGALNPRARNAVALGTGPGPAQPPTVETRDGSGIPIEPPFAPYGAPQFGANVGTGDIDGASVDEILTAPGPGAVYGPQVKAYLATGAALAKVNFYAYGTLRYGSRVGAGRTDADAFAEIVATPGPGAVFGPHVRGFDYDGAAVAPISGVNFFAFSTLKYGAGAATGTLDADAFEEIVAAPGPGAVFGANLRGFDVDGGAATAIAKVNFLAFSATTHGVSAGAGDVEGDGFAEILAAKGPGPANGADLAGFDYDGTAVAALPGFAYRVGITLFGAAVSAGDANADALEEAIAGLGPDPAAPPNVTCLHYDGAALGITGAFRAFGTLDRYGVTVAGGDLRP